MAKQKFSAKLIGRGPNGAWTFLPIDFDVHSTLGIQARQAVKGTINGFPFRNSLMPEGDGTYVMMVNKELQAGAKAKAGDTVNVTLEIDDTPRSVEIPDDLQASLTKVAGAGNAFAALSYSHQKEFVDWIGEAKKVETRARRIEKSLEMLAAKKHPKS